MDMIVVSSVSPSRSRASRNRMLGSFLRSFLEVVATSQSESPKEGNSAANPHRLTVSKITHTPPASNLPTDGAADPGTITCQANSHRNDGPFSGLFLQ